MRKIPTLFERNPDDRRHVIDQADPDAAWVLSGEGRPTRKYDGTCVMLAEISGWWARREVKPDKPVPPGFVAVVRDEVTAKTMGWVPIDQSSHAKAFHAVADKPASPGTYELCGPKVNGNPEGFAEHRLIPHGAMLVDAPRTFADLATWLHEHPWEGVVWHHPDGRMAKIKRRDFPCP